ncbi:glycosyltransferase [Actinomycetes bacterium M1A6_2h]
MTFNIWHAAFGDLSWAKYSCFYAQDDESAIPKKQSFAPLLRLAYRRIAERGLPVFAVSQTLLERIGPSGPGLVVPNGVDPTLWSALPVRPRSDASGARRPIAAYAGTVDTRIDVDAVRSLVEAGFEVRIAGPHAHDETVASLEQLDGVVLAGQLSRQEVATFLSQADVCFLAHVKTPLTEAMSPLKLYEYACTGRPTVSSRLGAGSAAVEGFPLCTYVENSDQFGAAALAALSAPVPNEAERFALIQQFSWRERHRVVVDALTGKE